MIGGSEGGKGAEWQMVTRREARAGVAKRTTTIVRSSATENDGASQQAPPSFDAASTAACRRKAEDSFNDKLAAMAETIAHLVDFDVLSGVAATFPTKLGVTPVVSAYDVKMTDDQAASKD